MAKKRVFTITFLSTIGFLLVLGGYWLFGALFSVDKTIPPEKLVKVETGSIAKSVVATGKVEPLSKVDIKSKASGLIKYLYVNAGDRVREGQLLVELDKETLEAELKEAKAFWNPPKAAFRKWNRKVRPSGPTCARRNSKQKTKITSSPAPSTTAIGSFSVRAWFQSPTSTAPSRRCRLPRLRKNPFGLTST